MRSCPNDFEQARGERFRVARSRSSDAKVQQLEPRTYSPLANASFGSGWESRGRFVEFEILWLRSRYISSSHSARRLVLFFCDKSHISHLKLLEKTAEELWYVFKTCKHDAVAYFNYLQINKLQLVNL